MMDKKRFESAALDDSAEIYNKDAKSERESFEEMAAKDKWRHFAEYYLLKVIFFVAAFSIVVFLIYNALRERDENVLYVAVFDETLDRNETEELTKRLEKMFGADGDRQKVIISDSFYTKEDGLSKLEIYMSSNVVDVIIADEEVFKELAAVGYMLDLSQLEDGEKFSRYYYNTAGCLPDEGTEISFEDNESGRGEVLPYGIDISGSTQFDKLGKLIERPVAGITINSKYKNNAEAFLELLMDMEVD